MVDYLNRRKIITYFLAVILIVSLSFITAKFSFLALAAVGALVIGLVFLLNVKSGIYILLVSLVAGQLIRVPLPVGEGGILVSDIFAGLLLISWVLKKLILKERFQRPFLFFPILGFAFIALVSLALNSANLTFEELASSGFYLIRWIEYAGIYFVASDLIYLGGEPTVKNLIRSLLAASVILALLGFVQLKIFPDFSPMVKYGWDPHQGRLLSTWFDPNFIGGFFAIILMFTTSLVLVCWQKGIRQQKAAAEFISYCAVSVIVFIALILTYSRSSYLAFGMGFLIVLLVFLTTCARGGKRWQALALSGSIIAVLAASLVFIFPRAQERIKGARDLDVTAQARLDSWKQAWGSIEDNYLIGVGYNTLRYTQSLKVSTLHSAAGFDSSLLTIWLTTGIFGLAFYASIWASIVKRSLSNLLFLNLILDKKIASLHTRALSLGMIGIATAILTHSMFVNSLLYPHIMISLWLLAAFLGFNKRNDKDFTSSRNPQLG